MPYTPAQERLFLAAAHNPDIAKSHDIGQKKARSMAMEEGPKARSRAMQGADSQESSHMPMREPVKRGAAIDEMPKQAALAFALRKNSRQAKNEEEGQS